MPLALAISAVVWLDSQGSSSSSLGLRKHSSWDRMQFAKRFKNFRLAVKLHIRCFGKQVCQHQMMSRTAAHPDVAVIDMQNLVVRRIEM